MTEVIGGGLLHFNALHVVRRHHNDVAILDVRQGAVGYAYVDDGIQLVFANNAQRDGRLGVVARHFNRDVRVPVATQRG